MDASVKDIFYYPNRTSGYQWTFDAKYWLKWHADYWTVSLLLSILYTVAVLIGQRMMANRKPFHLRQQLSLWSGTLAIFSIMGTYKMLPELINVLLNEGFHSSICMSSYAKDTEQLFWHWLFVWSKPMEFIDTLFIILRKQKLSFLHVYHHALTLICCFSFFPALVGVNRWAGSMNFFVHSFMYSYYSAKARGATFPRFIPMFITCIQILQMFIGFFVASYALGSNLGSYACNISFGKSLFCFSCYLSYFVLFLNFFIKSYFKGSAHKKVA